LDKSAAIFWFNLFFVDKKRSNHTLAKLLSGKLNAFLKTWVFSQKSTLTNIKMAGRRTSQAKNKKYVLRIGILAQICF